MSNYYILCRSEDESKVATNQSLDRHGPGRLDNRNQSDNTVQNGSLHERTDHEISPQGKTKEVGNMPKCCV